MLLSTQTCSSARVRLKGVKAMRHLSTSSRHELVHQPIFDPESRSSLSSSRSVCDLFEPLVPREKVTISTFRRGRSAATLSRSRVYSSVLCVSVRVCQSSAQSFGPVNSSTYRTRRPQWTAHASGRFRRMPKVKATTASGRTGLSSPSSSHMLRLASTLARGTGIHRRPLPSPPK